MNWAYLKEGIVKRTNLFDVTELVMIAQISFFFQYLTAKFIIYSAVAHYFYAFEFYISIYNLASYINSTFSFCFTGRSFSSS